MSSLVRVKFSPDPIWLLPTFLEVPVGILEVAAHGDLNLLAAVHQPKHDEQRHHRRHEVGIGHFPRAAMMAAVCPFFLDDDDGSFGLFHGGHVYAPALAAAAAPRVACATSLFHFFEVWSYVAGNRAPGNLDSHDGRCALHERRHQHPQHVIVGVLIFG